MLWRTKTDDNIAAIVTGSATIDNGIVYTGVSSKTSTQQLSQHSALGGGAGRAHRQDPVENLYGAAGFNGAAVWSSQPVVDHKTGMLYVTTGNSYSVPNGYCVNPGQTNCRRFHRTLTLIALWLSA